MLERVYDDIAVNYDERYDTPECHREDRKLFNWLEERMEKEELETVLDVGCGTGLFLQQIEVDRNNYYGFDPSEKSIEQAVRKYPQFLGRLAVDSFGSEINSKKHDLVVALYGVPSYISPELYKRFEGVTSDKGRYLLMFYLPEYSPHYYTPEMTKDVHDNMDYEKMLTVFPNVRKWAGKYLLASNKGFDGLEDTI